MAECDQNCSSCGESCGERKPEPDVKARLHEYSSVKKTIAVVSGKGGVGKSLVTAMTAAGMSRRGYKTAILDADLTGPSIPKVFGVTDKATGTEDGIFPVLTKGGIRLMSINLLLENESDPVLWRGPIIAATVKQFWSDCIWSDVDFMFIDMPPGTGDVPLTVFQSLPIDGILVVTSPQELVSMIVEKAVKMANMMNVPILGLIENMAYYMCPDCGAKHSVYGESHAQKTADQYGIPVLAQIPIDAKIAEACDEGLIELLPAEWLKGAEDRLVALLEKET